MSGDDEFEEFFVATYGGLHRTLTAICGSSETAADALQDAYQRAFTRWGRIGRYDNPAGWVRHVAINRCRDLARSEGRRRRNEERAAEAVAVADTHHDPDLVDLLRPLPERQRVALALHYLEGLSVAQTAQAMSISEGAVKYHLNRGRHQLRDELKATDSDD